MYARIQNNTAIEVIDFDPNGKFHASIVWRKVPGRVKQGWILDDGNWAPPDVPESVETTESEPERPVILSPIAFKMCFAPQERIGFYALAETDAIIKDWITILDDPRCERVDLSLTSTRDAVRYLVGKVEGFTDDRAAAVLQGTLV